MAKAKVPSLQHQQMTAEHKKDVALRSFITKRNSIAEGIIFNAVQGLGDKFDVSLVDKAIETADRYMEKAFGLKAEGPKSEE